MERECGSEIKDLSLSLANNRNNDSRYGCALCTGFKRMKINSCIEREKERERDAQRILYCINRRTLLYKVTNPLI